MKFSIIYEAQMAEETLEAEVRCFNEIVEQVVLAEEQGFDTVWCVEHTALTQYAHMSAPETMLAFLAGKTSRIGIGHGVVCLPPAMNHPVKVAERIATLDILSGGRVHFGMGKGGTQQESGTFGYDLAELQPMIDEAMYLIPKIMTQPEIEHNGKYVQIPRRPIHPKPLQKPHPPLYMACTKESTLETAGKRGIGALVLGFSGPEEIGRKNKVYRAAFANRKAEDQVGLAPTEHLAAFCAACVLDDRDEARRVGLKGQRFFAEAIAHWYNGGPKPTVHIESAEDNEAALAATREQVVAYISDEKITEAADAMTSNYTVAQDAYGNADDCIRYVTRLQEAGADEILFLFQMGTIPHESILETIRNIGQKVIPHFRDQQTALAAE